MGLIIIGLVALLFLQRQCTPAPQPNKPEVIVKRDTVYVPYDTVITKKVFIYKHIPAPEIPPRYLPDTNYAKLKEQYKQLVKAHISKNVYLDSVAVGSYGHIKITDTVTENTLLSRKYEQKFSIPVVKETITIQAPPKRQVYVGGGINMFKTLSPATAKVGLMYKNKKDQLYGINSQIDMSGNISYGVDFYWKINLKK